MVAFSLNMPTPVVVQKDSEVAFPCQNCPCGCKNADQCWDSCCCFSDAEKMSWARANKVSPPGWFLERFASQPSIACIKPTASTSSAAEPPFKKVACCCCHPVQPNPISAEQSAPKSPRRTIEVRTTIQQLLGCSGKQELLKKQIVYLLATAQPPAAAPFRQSLPVISESACNLAIIPPIPPS